LYDLVRRGLVNDLIETAEKLQVENSQHTAFFQHLLAMAKSYRLKAMREFLEKYIDDFSVTEQPINIKNQQQPSTPT
jgi:hypothetical protein